jgi:DNA-binding NtrC family response regulator
MAEAIAQAKRAAASRITVLIEGESGVGKEVIARAIHAEGARSGKPFVTLNCGAIPAGLVESVLFGHERGAFTSAAERRPGRFREADGGTLFLDEVSELPAEIQVKLLRVLQDGEVDPVGSRRPLKVDFRLIAATNRSLADLVAGGRFREDLYYRLEVFPIRLPPLRERREDIPELARRFAARFAAEEGKAFIRGIAPAALDLLCGYDWPGNVRQLQNAVFRAVVLADGAVLGPDEFPQLVACLADRVGKNAPPVLPNAVSFDELRRRPAAAGAGAGFDDTGEVLPLAEVEARMIRLALIRCRGRIGDAARRLGIGRSTLYRKLRALNPDPRASGDVADL